MALSHLERLRTNNQNGEFKNLINKTQPLFDSFKSKINIKAIEAASKESKTVSVDNIIDETINYINGKFNLIAYVFPKDSPEYQEFFPLGLKEYTQVSKKTFPEGMCECTTLWDSHDKIISRFLSAAEKYRDKFFRSWIIKNTKLALAKNNNPFLAKPKSFGLYLNPRLTTKW